MPFYKVNDWTAAYDIEPHIAGAEGYYAAWASNGEAYRTAFPDGSKILDLPYGPGPRNTLDLFQPQGTAKGLVVFVHGGYWMECDKGLWSHYARGAVERGYAVCVPGYTLCPDIRIGGIAAEVAAAVELAAGMVAGPIALTGHSAGGHLATRLVSAPQILTDQTLDRVLSVLSISGLHDLRPLMLSTMNRVLGIDEAETRSESPALLRPARAIPLTCWVGSAERAEFLRQNELLANVWAGLGCATRTVIAPDRNHFDVIEGLFDPGSDLTQALLQPMTRA